MKFNLKNEYIIQKAIKAGEVSTILLPSGPYKVHLNAHKTKTKYTTCYFTNRMTNCVLIMAGGFCRYYVSGDILVTMAEMSYDLRPSKMISGIIPKAIINPDLKKAKKDRILILSRCHELKTENPNLFDSSRINFDNIDFSDSLDSSESIESIKNCLTQKKYKRYSCSSKFDLDQLVLEIQKFYINKRFGWIGRAQPEILVKKEDDYRVLRCFTSKTSFQTWGNSNETAINVIIKKNVDSIEFYCGFTGNKHITRDGISIVAAVVTGGVSLVGNAASLVKDEKIVNEAMFFIDSLMKNSFSNMYNKEVDKSQNDIPSQIKKIAELRDLKILSEEEFQNKKNDLLDRI